VSAILSFVYSLGHIWSKNPLFNSRGYFLVVSSFRPKQDFRKPRWVSARWIWRVPFYPVAVTSDWHWSKESATDRQSCCEAGDFRTGSRQRPSTELPRDFFALLQSIGCSATIRTNFISDLVPPLRCGPLLFRTRRPEFPRTQVRGSHLFHLRNVFRENRGMVPKFGDVAQLR
jgi:hypothetical protein